MSLKDQILKLLRRNDGLTDREITDSLLGASVAQQRVNQACRKLELEGLVLRYKRSDNLIGNFLNKEPVTTAKTSKRKDTKLEAVGAEFLVLGQLLIEGIDAYKAYIDFPGYDLVAVNPVNGRNARIQVKSRWATDYDGSFPIKNFSCDFVVHVALNRGFSFRKPSKTAAVSLPQLYVFPIELIQGARNPKSSWGKVSIRKIPQYETYLNRWDLIRNFLAIR